jgi:hypothetical protein
LKNAVEGWRRFGLVVPNAVTRWRFRIRVGG